MLPTQIDRYHIRAEIGRGGMATVYRAYDPRFEREVAVKVLPPHFLHDPNFATRFKQEAKIIASLEHTAIVPVHDFGEADGQPFLVMRFLTGGTLAERIKRLGPLPLAEISRILARLAPALDKAHERGIIHRDLKPENILFDEDGLPYLTDFGIARLAEATRTMTVAGTPSYMSPEQVKGGQKLDGRSDLYALGIILFEMLTGKRPFHGDTPTQIMMQHVLAPVPDVAAIKADLAPFCRPLIFKALAKEPADRYPTAAALAAALTGMDPVRPVRVPSVYEPTVLENMAEPVATTYPPTAIEAPPPVSAATYPPTAIEPAAVESDASPLPPTPETELTPGVSRRARLLGALVGLLLGSIVGMVTAITSAWDMLIAPATSLEFFGRLIGVLIVFLFLGLPSLVPGSIAGAIVAMRPAGFLWAFIGSLAVGIVLLVIAGIVTGAILAAILTASMGMGTGALLGAAGWALTRRLQRRS